MIIKKYLKLLNFRKIKDSAILAILFTDIVGYSSLVNEIGDDEAFKIITYYENIMYQIINEDNSGIIN